MTNNEPIAVIVITKEGYKIMGSEISYKELASKLILVIQGLEKTEATEKSIKA